MAPIVLQDLARNVQSYLLLGPLKEAPLSLLLASLESLHSQGCAQGCKPVELYSIYSQIVCRWVHSGGFLGFVF